MKAAAFDYYKARDLDDVCRALAEPMDGGETKIIAGGQTLVPLMAMRLARPARLIDVNDIEALKGISIDGEALVIGAGTRQRGSQIHTASRTSIPHVPMASAAIVAPNHAPSGRSLPR